MSKLDNYIFYSICEKSIEIFENTNYLTYRSFCIGMKNTIIYFNFDSIDNQRISLIIKNIELIYGLEYEKVIEYIYRYFIEEKYIVFEEPVRITLDFFKNSFN